MSSSLSSETSNVNEEALKNVQDLVYKKVQDVLKDIRGGKLYYEEIEKLGLINKDNFNYLVNLQISVRMHTPEDKQWEISNEMQDLTLLAITFCDKFYDQNMYSKEALQDIKTVQTNLLNITKWLFSNNKSEQPLLVTNFSEHFKDVYADWRNDLNNALEEDGIFVFKDNLNQALVALLVQTSFASMYHKPLTGEDLKDLNWKKE
jgi:hypothetical protein